MSKVFFENEVGCIKGAGYLRLTIFVGIFWFVLGLAYIPMNKTYQQGIVMLLFVPTALLILLNFKLIHGFFVSNRCFSFLSASMFLYVFCNGVFFDSMQSVKHILYVVLFLFLGFFIVFFDFDKKVLNRSVFFVFVGVAAICLYSFYDFFYLRNNDFFSRMWGVLGVHHPILASYYIGFFLILSIVFLSEKYRYYMLPFIAIFTAFIFFSQSRGAYVSILITMISYFVFFSKKNKVNLLIALISLAVSLALAYLFSDQIMSRGSSYRPEIILSSINMGLEKLWFGHGIGHSFLIYTANYPEGFEHTHNLPLHIFIELGLIGALLFLFLWFFCFYTCFKNKDLFLAKFNVLIIIFSSIAFQFDAASFIAQPRLEWFVVWVPISLTVAVMAIRFMENSKQRVNL